MGELVDAFPNQTEDEKMELKLHHLLSKMLLRVLIPFSQFLFKDIYKRDWNRTGTNQRREIFENAFQYYFNNPDQYPIQLEQIRTWKIEKLDMKLVIDLLIYFCQKKEKTFSKPMVKWLVILKNLRNFAEHPNNETTTTAAITKEWKKLEKAIEECGRRLRKAGRNGDRYFVLRDEVRSFRSLSFNIILDETVEGQK